MVARTPEEASVAALAEQYLPVARILAGRLRRRFRWVPADDLYSYSLWGLTLAAKEFAPDRGVPFARFAMQKGMFLAIDAMRRDKVVRRRDAAAGPVMVCRSQLAGEDESRVIEIVDRRSGQDTHRLETADQAARLLGKLGRADRKLMMLYYADGLTFREIAGVLGKSEATVCLRHRTLLGRLRELARTGRQRTA